MALHNQEALPMIITIIELALAAFIVVGLYKVWSV